MDFCPFFSDPEIVNWPLAQSRVIYQLLRVEQLDQWWHWGILAGVFIVCISFVVVWYRKDSVEHARPVGWALLLLRIAVFVGLLLFFLQLEKRSEQRVVRESKVAVLVDTSMSMTLPGTPSATGVSSSLTRSEEVVRLLGESDFLRELSEQHEVNVYTFGQGNRANSLAAIPKQSASEAVLEPTEENSLSNLQGGRNWMLGCTAIGTIGLLFYLIAIGAQIRGANRWRPGGWYLLAGAACMLLALGLSTIAILPNSQYPLIALWGGAAEPIQAQLTDASEDDVTVSLPDDWGEALTPRGTSTHLGDAIKSVLDREVGSPLAGILVLTDGKNNGGVAPKALIAAAQNAEVPIYAVGLGSALSPSNVTLVEVDVPRRLYPGDRFTLSALVGGNGFDGQQVTVQVLSGAPDADVSQLGIEGEIEVVIPADGSLASAQFELEPKSVGSWQYAVQVIAVTGDSDATDNLKSVEIEVVERKNRVLILAGGPTREYQFVRNLLYRDRDVDSHVLLQTGTANTSQEAQQLLDQFPADRTALSNYDAVLAFDADWTAIDESAVDALENWVAEQAGGFLLVAGSVEMPKWLARSASGTRAQNLRALSPVVLEKRGGTLLASGRVEAETAWPLTLTPDGEQTEFLWLTDERQTSLDLWESFSGVHSFYAGYKLKPGARSLLQFSDPVAAIDGQQPIYLATQFYGAGRSAFLGGSELWRIRELGDQYFDRFYTKLVRWISQGRLLMDSDRGVLLLDKEQAMLGEDVVLRAVLKDERYEPLIQSEVVARLIDPKERNQPIVLRPFADGSQPGVYVGQFPVLFAGDYVAQLQLGGLASDEILTAELRARVPAAEMQNAERDDQVLGQLANETGGVFWRGTEEAVKGIPSQGASSDGSSNAATNTLATAILSQDQVAYLPGTPDQAFQLRWLAWLMTWIAGCLTLEWVARRIHRLA